MGVDLVGIIGHTLTKKEIVSLPNEVNKWQDVNRFFSSYDERALEPAKWDGIINEEQLELIWQNFETTEINKEILNKMENFDTQIDCNFGTLSIYRRTILISHWNHKYSNLRNLETAKNILKLNRMIAKHFNQNEIIYCTDSGYPTQSIEDKALSGLEFEDLKRFGISEFGIPPKDLNEGRKYMYFIDDFNEDLNKLTSWDGEKNPYWYYDTAINGYKLKAYNKS